MVQTRSATKKATERDAPAQKPPKRARANPRTKSGPQKSTSKPLTMRGRLSMLPETNLDVLSQILSYLHPKDLLSLARLTRQFRQFLMSKSHAFIWIAARKRVPGFPDLPPDLSEPEYANLAFDPHCHICGRISRTIYWNIRRRYCSGCRDERLLKLYRCDGLPSRRMLLSEHLQSAERQWFLDNEDEYADSEQYADSKQYAALRKEYAQVLPAERDEYIARRHELVARIKEHAEQCEEWHDQVVADRKEELAQAKMARSDSIFARLESAGYGREIQYWGQERIMESCRDPFRSSKPLTEKDWNAVHSKMQLELSEFRERRIGKVVHYPRRTLLLTLYNHYIQHPAPKGGAVDVLPSIWDVAHFTPFDVVLNLPEDETVDETTFQPAFDQLPSLARQWRKEIDARLVSLVNFDADSEHSSRKEPTQTRPRGKDTPPKDPFKLACAVFMVEHPFNGQCHVFPYPHVLTELSVFYDGRKGNRLWLRPPWILFPQGWDFITLFTGAQDVVRACGLDPQTATVEDMDQVNARLICNACRTSDNPSTNVEIFKWKSAIFHADSPCHSSWKGNLWTLLDKTLVAMVEPKEKAYDRPREPCYHVFCALCQRRADATKYFLTTHHPSSPRRLSVHLDEIHGVKEETSALQENVHYFASWEGSNDLLRTIRIKNGDGAERSTLF